MARPLLDTREREKREREKERREEFFPPHFACSWPFPISPLAKKTPASVFSSAVPCDYDSDGDGGVAHGGGGGGGGGGANGNGIVASRPRDFVPIPPVRPELVPSLEVLLYGFRLPRRYDDDDDDVDEEDEGEKGKERTRPPPPPPPPPLYPLDLDLLLTSTSTSTSTFSRLRYLLLENCAIRVTTPFPQAKRLLSAFVVVFPVLLRVHLHGSTEDEGAARVFDALDDLYWATRGEGEGAFRGVCRGCGAWKWRMTEYRNEHQRMDEFWDDAEEEEEEEEEG